MTGHVNRLVTHTVRATEDLSGAKNKLVTLNGTIAQAASGRAVAGLLEMAVGSGYNHTAIMLGIHKGVAGAAVTSVGWPVAAANSGFLTNATSGQLVVGRFLATCSSGDMVEVALDTLNAGQVLA